VPITYADIARTTDLLGYKVTVPFTLGIRKFAQWFLDRRR